MTIRTHFDVPYHTIMFSSNILKPIVCLLPRNDYQKWPLVSINLNY